VQWHPTILARLALVDQRTINSFSKGSNGGQYVPGDIVVRFTECTGNDVKVCEGVAQHYAQLWQNALKSS
jgi:mannan polymerase II complex MNN11 subunit